MSLPVNYRLRIWTIVSLLVVLLTAAASLVGILYPDAVYRTAEISRSFIANDWVNLIIGLPVLIITMWLARRGSLLGLLFWPGAFFYGLYNYTAYLFGVPFGRLFWLYLLIVILSVYALIGLAASIDGQRVKKQLAGGVPARLGGGALVVMSLLFILRALAMLLGDPGSIAAAEQGVLAADIVSGSAVIIGGILLWRHYPLGYVSGPGLLFQGTMLFVGVILVLIIQSIQKGAPLPLVDLAVLLVMGLVYFVPFILFSQGIIQMPDFPELPGT